MQRLLFAIVFSAAGGLFHPLVAQALSSDPRVFISADNIFYAYVKGGETISASFARTGVDEQFNTVQGDVTVTMDGPGAAQQKCVLPKDVPIGQGCSIAPQTAQQTGIWRIQFAVPSNALPYPQVSKDVKWGKNLFNWNIAVKSNDVEQRGRLWTERYAIRQPAPASFLADMTYYYVSEDGYIYKAIEYGYNGQISTLSADAIGIRAGNDCVSAYQSVDVDSVKYSPALGVCGNAYKLFFEEPAGGLPVKAKKWDGTEDWVRPRISRPSINELHFQPDNSLDQLSGDISFYLRNFVGQYQIKIDVDNDGSFDGQSDVTLNEQMKKLSNGLQRVHFNGVDKYGQVIAPSETIGIQVVITKVAEIHLVAADVEGRTGGLELIRLSGENAPTTRLCWNDTELDSLAVELMTKKLNGKDCPDSTGGVHGWSYADNSWGNGRYIDDWIYASAKLDGKNRITYPEGTTVTKQQAGSNLILISAGVAGGIGTVIAMTLIIIVLRRRSIARAQRLQAQYPIAAQSATPTADPSGEPPRNDQIL